MDGFSRSTEEWITTVNESVKKFQVSAIRKNYSVSADEFNLIF